MTSVKNFNRLTPWSGIAAVLGLPCQSRAFPARTDCPLCGGHRLHVYQDNINHGQWHYCFDCHESGDMIELVAKVWQVSPQAAVRKLAKLGFDLPPEMLTEEMLGQYVINHPQHRHRWRSFWEQSRMFLTTTSSASIARLRSKFKLISQVDKKRWLAGPGLFVGACSVSSAFQLHRTLPASYRRVIFKGGGWQDVLVIPYHHVPDGVSAFLYVGREGAAKDRVLRTIDNNHATSEPHHEVGLAGLPSVTASKGSFGDYVFAVDDPLLMLRLQVRHVATSTLPLPIVSWWHQPKQRTQNAWFSLLNRKVVFLAWKITPELVWQAQLVDGLIALIPLNDHKRSTIDHYIRLCPPADLLRKNLRRAKPWRDALVDWAKQQDRGGVEELLLNLDGMGYDTFELETLFGRTLTDSMDIPVRRQLPYRRGQIIERENGWWFVSRKNDWELISEAIVRIDEIVNDGTRLYKGEETVRYRGRVLFRGEELPFDYSIKSLRHVTRIVTQLCQKAGLGRPKFAPARDWDVLAIAVLFQEPRNRHILPPDPEELSEEPSGAGVPVKALPGPGTGFPV
jgi:hypothetical protein